MTKENGPVITELKNLSDIPLGKKAFVLVGEEKKYPEITELAANKKAFLAFYHADKLENVDENSLVSIVDQKIGTILNLNTNKSELEEFIKNNSYPIVGQLGPEN